MHREQAMVTRTDRATTLQTEIPAMTGPLPEEIHIATVNIKNSNDYSPSDPKDVYIERPWSERKTRLVDALLSTGPLDVLGLQEVLHNQLKDMSELLGERYGYVGVGREDGKEKGEYAPIFYDRTKFEIVEWGTVWLSPTPDQPGSVGWDAALTRIATLLTVRYKDASKKGELLHAVNTHYDHAGVEARAQSSLLIRSQIWQWVKKVEDKEKPGTVGPVVLFGDFNSPPEEKGYKNITALAQLPSKQPSFTFLDAYTNLVRRSPRDPSATLQTLPYGPVLTYTGFKPPGYKLATRIDFVMLGADVDEAQPGVGRGGFKVTRYACIDNMVPGDAEGWNARWSDHRAVRAAIARAE